MVDTVTVDAAGLADTTEQTRAVVSWAGEGQPIMLTLYGPDGELAVALLPKRALTLAQELLARGVQAIKVDWPEQELEMHEKNYVVIKNCRFNEEPDRFWAGCRELVRKCFRLNLSSPFDKGPS